MTIQNEINQLENKLKELRHKQAQCQHKFTEPKYNPYMGKKEIILPGQYETHGIHMYPKTQWVDEKKPRWTRTCTVCGLEQHTEKQQTINHPETKPVFE